MDASLWGLFASAFLASTLLPGGSEAVFGYLLLQQQYPASTLILVAGVGNTLGGMTSWGIGRLLALRYDYQHSHKAELVRAMQRLHRYGAPVLLLSWLPVIGDPLCLAAGWLCISAWSALLYIALGKLARYAVLAVVLQGGYEAWQAVL